METLSPTAQAAADPFYTTKNAVQNKLFDIQKKYDAWKNLLENSNTDSSVKFAKLHRDLPKEFENINKMIDLLNEVQSKLESDPSSFTHINEVEMKQRRNFIDSTRSTISGMQSEYKKSKSKIDSDRKKNILARKEQSEQEKLFGGLDNNNDKYIKKSQDQQADMMIKQDQDLSMIGDDVDRLGQMASAIGDEINTHNTMLIDMNEEMDEATTKMGQARQQIGKLLKTNNNCELMTILILIAVAVVCFFLAIA
ncbi:hypothetical protein WA158_007700 [Blastocystis sp. Blastoise]